MRRIYESMPGELLEHLHALKGEIQETLRKMEMVPLTEKEVNSKLRKLQNHKQPGPDGIKTEMHKWMRENVGQKPE